MGLTAAQLRAGLDVVAARDPRIAAAIARAGYPEERIRGRGMVTLLRTIVGQQVSYKAADSIWAKAAGIV
ncbi:MAG: DNA-3-methyladenine glycosylase 2 family protein, partial [Polymorphobacter sp.]